MPYSPTNWVEGTTKVGPTNLNKIETALTKMPYGPDFLTDNVPVWNGTGWVAQKIVNAQVDAAAAIAYSKLNLATSIVNGDIAAAAAIAISKLAGYPTDARAFLKGDGTWGGIELVTALPGSPTNNDLVVFTDSVSAPTYQWLLQYVAAKASNKWICLNGVPLSAEVAAFETTTSTTYAALTTAGPSVAIPVAGDYFVDAGFSGGDSAVFQLMSFDIGGTGAVDGDAVRMQNSATATEVGSAFRRQKKTGLTAVTLTAKYRSSAAGTAGFAKRFLAIVPIAIGG